MFLSLVPLGFGGGLECIMILACKCACPPFRAWSFTKLDKGYVLDQAREKYSFTDLGISITYEFKERASYLHAMI